MCGNKGVWEISLPSPPFYYEPKMALEKVLKRDITKHNIHVLPFKNSEVIGEVNDCTR